MDIKYDCRFFNGAVPCRPHKQHLVECSSECPEYQPTDYNILIIKLGAMGDVIRTTPLLHRIKKEHPAARIFWLSQYPDVLPEVVDWPLKFNLENLTWLQSLEFKLGINLDKDPEACALMEQLEINERFGFGLNQGMPAPVNDLAIDKFLTGISDLKSRDNTVHYLEEIFSIAGWSYQEEEYILSESVANSSFETLKTDKKLIGLNTGCGERWTSRLWPEAHWVKLIKLCQMDGYQVLLLGGPQEDEKNQRLALETGASYPGFFPIREFFNLVDRCDLVVSAVTMAMHVAIGLKKPLILFNNIFNPHEFHFFVKSKILSPEKPCECYYRPTCIHGEGCLKDIPAELVLETIQLLLSE